MKIYLLGDVGEMNKNTKKIFNNIKKDGSEKVILLLGDNFYPDGVSSVNDEQWLNFKDINIDFPIYAILGNHDYLGNVKAQIGYNKNNWNLPNFYYKKTFGNIDFFFIDTSIILPTFSNIDYTIVKSKLGHEPLDYCKKMLDWLEDELSKTKNYKIVVGHYPISSLGIYGINKKLFIKLFPIFKKYDVKYYISGHDHNLQIVDIFTVGFEMKQIISAGTSHLYPIIDNASKKIFSCFGTVMFDLKDNLVKILDLNLKTLYQEKLLFKKN